MAIRGEDDTGALKVKRHTRVGMSVPQVREGARWLKMKRSKKETRLGGGFSVKELSSEGGRYREE